VPPARSALARPLLIYAVSRLLTLAAAAVATVGHPGSTMWGVLAGWDGNWYRAVATGGYPSSLPHGVGLSAQSGLAFFPAYPFAMRLVWRLTPLTPLGAGIFVSMVAGAIAALLVRALVRHLADAEAAERAFVLFCFFPGAFIFSMIYAEGVMLVGAAACLLALLRKRWVLAGLGGALASAARGNGLVLTLCCAWVAALAIRRDRDWKALAAPILAPLGAVAYFAFLKARTGSFTTWFTVERNGWNERFDFASTNWNHAHRFLHHPFRNANELILGLSLLFAIGAGIALVRSGLPSVLAVYTFATLALVFLSATLGVRPRFLLTAFPLLVPIAMRARGSTFTVTASAFAGTMTLLLIFYGVQPLNGVAP
jgi:4-amino-4-deoxy-L-arabinose transferase-like glycosyltransferase